MRVGDLVYCPCREPAVTGIVVEIEESSPFNLATVLVMTDQGPEWWEEYALELVQ